jgi:hypothetical protein
MFRYIGNVSGGGGVIADRHLGDENGKRMTGKIETNVRQSNKEESVREMTCNRVNYK